MSRYVAFFEGDDHQVSYQRKTIEEAFQDAKQYIHSDGLRRQEVKIYQLVEVGTTKVQFVHKA